MNRIEKELTQRWINTWQQAGEALKDIKRQELQQYDYVKNLPIIEDMLQWAYEHRTPRLTSGSARCANNSSTNSGQRERKAMNGLFEAALEVQQFMQARGWPFCISRFLKNFVNFYRNLDKIGGM